MKQVKSMSNVFSGVCNVSQDATVKYLPSGQAVLNVSVANNVGFGDNQKTVWIRVALWGKRAEGTLVDYLRKGQAVFISGEMTTNEYTKNDGTKGFQVEVNANVIDLVGGKRSENASAAYESHQQDPYPPAAYTTTPPPAPPITPQQQYERDLAAYKASLPQPPKPPQQADDDIPF
jgi:single-strand DNA-binding protein